MAYRDFKASDLKDKLGITSTQDVLFPNVKKVEPSLLLVQILERNSESTSLRTEKAVSEALVAPVLQEVQVRNREKITLFSGENLVADKSKGLNGELDFLFLNSSYALDLTDPIISITEAKLDRALIKAVNQCAAQMAGAQIFNQKYNHPYEFIYGAVTDGYQWRFLKLQNNILTVDKMQYSTNNLPELLGVLQTIVDFY